MGCSFGQALRVWVLSLNLWGGGCIWVFEGCYSVVGLVLVGGCGLSMRFDEVVWFCGQIWQKLRFVWVLEG